MPKTMLVNVTHVEESRVAILDDGVLAAYDIETTSRASIKGNIHNAIVESVHPSLEAAFVRIGPEMKGFLPLDEINFKLLPSRTDSRKLGRIGQHVHPGQKLMVQVVREPFAEKPPTVSTYFSLPGRFLVLMPGVDAGGVSRKIESSEQRDRLKQIIDELKVPDGFGVIVRTAGLGQTKGELQRDLRYLLRLWESIQRASRAAEFPAQVYREADLVIRTIRDHFTKDIAEVWIDSQEVHDRALAFVRDVMPTKVKTIRIYRGDRPLFSKFDLEEQIERIYKRRVPLPSGGEIVIDGTEALTAIDVNTARSRRKGDAEESAAQTNLEAAAEIARQLRLRDLGGLIVIDFIDMMKKGNNSKVEKAMRDALKADRARHDITRLSKLGLMEIARQRLKGAKLAASYATCPSCDGYGLIKNVETAGLAALRKLQARSTRGGIAKITVTLPPDVANWVQNQKRDALIRLSQRGREIEIVPDAALLRHESKFEIIARERQSATPSPVTANALSVAEAPEVREAEKTAEIVPFPAAPPDTPENDPAQEPGKRKPRSKRAPRRSRAKASARIDEPAVVETAVAVAVAEPTDDAAAGDSAEGDGTNGRRRRRRRRRRPARGAGTDGAGPERSAADGADGAADDDRQPRKPAPEKPAPAVPAGVRADELMPAAVGSTREQRPSRGSGSSNKPRGKTTSRRRRKPPRDKS